jgi:HJR/Mrr/RecB family endonuclease
LVFHVASVGLALQLARPPCGASPRRQLQHPVVASVGDVVIQAKRYKNTVGVSAVRDLFGTLQNEGASKGILVTTSGYGPASFEFARNKPIEFIDGANLLYLLETHRA